jgi:hypothetical protein
MPVPDPFAKAVPVALDDEAPWFKWMTENWPDRATVAACHDFVRRMDVARAAQPPVVNVTVGGIPGHFTGTPSGPVAYSPDSLA